jgi:hypothetical protein
MAVSTNPLYRNNRKNFYTEKSADTLCIGTVIQVLKSDQNSQEHNFIPSVVPNNGGTTKYSLQSGNAIVEDNPDFQYPGYLYCDGAEYYIKDYPALFAIVGDLYGGTPNNGIKVNSGGSGYGSSTVVNFSAAPSGGTTATGLAIISSGVITGIQVTNTGKGYTTAPTITFSNTGGGSAANVVVTRILGGSITAVTKENIFQVWPDDNMGTFKVPDFKAKRLVGNGPVYGAGTASVGNSALGVGPSTIDGKWYFDEASQKGEFTLGKVSTTGYENVTDSIPGQIIGTQTATVTMDGKRLSGPPQHSHFLLHSEASQDTSQPRKGSGDFYIRGYKNTTGKLQNYTAVGGLSLTHTHIMSKAALTDTTVASYDIYNFSGGDSGSGTLKEAGYYYASGGVGAGSYETITSTAAPTFKKFNSSSVIGGRTVVVQGTPVYSYTNTVYSNPGTFTFTMPGTWDSLAIQLAGASGSGGVATVPGNTGGSTTVVVGNSTLLTMTSTGGGGGGAATANAGGGAGAAGSTSYSGTLMNATAQAAGNSIATINGANATAGVGTTTYVASISGWTPSSGASLPSGTFTTGKGGVNYAQNQLSGSDGNYSYTSSQPTVGPTTYTTSQTVSVGWSATAGKLKSLTWTLAGARGGSSTGSPTYANGGPGNVLSLPYNDSSLISFTNGTGFSLYVGSIGAVNGGGAASFGPGGNGGPPGGSGTYGAGGGGATSLTLNSNIIAGAGGGGGAGGYDPQYGDYGDSGNAGSLGLISATTNLYGGAGKNGGGAGCNGGGGGGGGGGIDTNATGASAGGGGGGAGHYGGYAGQRGYSAYKSTFFNAPTSNTDSNYGSGYGTLTYQTEQSYYTPPAGGGGQTKVLSALILKAGATAVSASFSSVSITVGLGATGVNSGGYYSSAGSNGEVLITTGVITSYSGGQIITTVGDIVKLASDGVEIYDSGTGSGTSGGFKLPTTQVPTVVLESSSGGSGATATATVSNGAVSGVSLTTGGSGYQSIPAVRFLGGAGSGTIASATKNAAGVVTGLTYTAGSSTAYTKYIKFGGSSLERYIILVPVDCTTVKRLTIKVARGNGVNGGDLPENGGDELKVYYNTDGSTNFPDNKFIGTIVPVATAAEIASNYDGTGSGTEATKWYSYSIDLPEGAQTDGVSFKITQKRAVASGLNDNAGDTDQYGICDIVYENKAVTSLVFVPSEGKISTAGDALSYTVSGDPKAQYSTGMSANDATFTLTSSVPLLPQAAIDPDNNIALLEPYFLVKHLIKAF